MEKLSPNHKEFPSITSSQSVAISNEGISNNTAVISPLLNTEVLPSTTATTATTVNFKNDNDILTTMNKVSTENNDNINNNTSLSETDEQLTQRWKALGSRIDKLELYRQNQYQDIRKRLSIIQENSRNERINNDPILFTEILQNMNSYIKDYMHNKLPSSSTDKLENSSLLSVEEYIRKANITLGEPIDDGILITDNNNNKDDNIDNHSLSTNIPNPNNTYRNRGRYIYLQNCTERIYLLWGQFITWCLFFITGVSNKPIHYHRSNNNKQAKLT